MTNSLSTVAQPEARLPAIPNGFLPATQRTSDLIGYLHNNLEPIPGNFRRYALSAAHEPTPEQRQVLLDRRGEIDAGLVGADETTIRERVGALRAVMATPQAGEATVAIARQAFIAVLSRYPGWAVSEACTRFLDGRAGNKVYAPSPAEIAEICRSLIADALTERARINAVLDAEIYQPASPEDRAIIAQRHAEYVAASVAASQHVSARGAETGTDAVERAKAAADLERRRISGETRPASDEAATAGADDDEAAE